MAWTVGEKKSGVKKGAGNKIVEMQPSAKDADGHMDSQDKPKDEPAKEKDLGGGMEMLELDFLLGVVESAGGNDKNDVMMQKLTFNELLRRQQQKQIDSNALTVYAVNQGNLYGKDIQCEAMKELTKRTVHKS